MYVYLYIYLQIHMHISTFIRITYIRVQLIIYICVLPSAPCFEVVYTTYVERGREREREREREIA